MYQACYGQGPDKDQPIQWLPHTGETVEDVRKKVKSDPTITCWDGIFIRKIDS